MRYKIVAGNWKMNLNAKDGRKLVKDIAKGVAAFKKMPDNVQIVVSPTAPYLSLLLKSIPKEMRSFFHVAAQNCHAENGGAFTGEVAPAMLKDIGCDSVIIGHSERRKYFGETDDLLAKKIDQALANELGVIYCCGELVEQRQANCHFDVVSQQVKQALFHLDKKAFENIVIAYEPVWAIGTGLTATPEQAEEMHAHIRQLIATKYTNKLANDTTILYGGSVKPANAKELFSQKNVDGGLVGGASLKADSFLPIIEAII